MLTFTVPGKPTQMGSKRAFIVGGKDTKPRAVITDTNSKARQQWANAVAAQASEAMAGRAVLTGPIELRARFCFLRPKSHYGTGRNAGTVKAAAPVHHTQIPDLDKLARCLCDALTGIVYRDDKQVHVLEVSRQWTTEQAHTQVWVADTLEVRGDTSPNRTL